MDLVDEEQRAPALLATSAGPVESLLQVLHAREDRRELFELELHLVGKQPGNRRLAGAGRPPEDEAWDAPGLQHPRQCAIGSDQMILADHLGERCRPQPVSQRPGRSLVQASRFEEVRHGSSVSCHGLEANHRFYCLSLLLFRFFWRRVLFPGCAGEPFVA